MGNPIVSIGASLVGGMMNRKAASQDRAAQQAAIDANMAGFNMAKPYLEKLYNRGYDAMNDRINTGTFQGQTFAGLDPLQTEGINMMSDFARAQNTAANGFMAPVSGFGQNAADIFNRARQDGLQQAQQYAINNSQPLVDAAMRDQTRQLAEQTLPGINQSASATGNTNSSRAGVTEAIAQRAYDDRRADVAANIQDQLMSRSLAQRNADLSNMASANNNMMNIYGFGQDTIGKAGTALSNAGATNRAVNQGFMSDAEARFQRDRDFTMDSLNQYNAGILSQAPRSVSNIEPNMVNKTAATMGGAMQGFGFGETDMGMAIGRKLGFI